MNSFTTQVIVLIVFVLICIAVGVIAYKLYRGLTKKDGDNRR